MRNVVLNCTRNGYA